MLNNSHTETDFSTEEESERVESNLVLDDFFFFYHFLLTDTLLIPSGEMYLDRHLHLRHQGFDHYNH